ncbi:LIM/homeobox protein Lhx9-like isoform X1 [Copidosoma floridanum]|uniref:LIM/homeobox protein Lhx9-like isoform X1 n=1 Tax=Copidosoma floridanum TaxID=29053 RepID=UPI0006C98DE2|nr:LIM/homeobox protein Lhx9-like isoform X1 [Copidosoma floridanum]XP_014216894.1 LIM/homeobox protein Lhx9-like isoform X1 [Copidosoma floridanum]
MTMDVSKSESSRNGTGQQECAGCRKPITERYLLRALDMYWHEDCLKCSCCDCRLGEVGSTCYTKANLVLCKRDYLRLFGNTGHCAACSKVIPAFEMVMRARANVYHLECFACQQCNHSRCQGVDHSGRPTGCSQRTAWRAPTTATQRPRPRAALSARLQASTAWLGLRAPATTPNDRPNKRRRNARWTLFGIFFFFSHQPNDRSTILRRDKYKPVEGKDLEKQGFGENDRGDGS